MNLPTSCSRARGFATLAIMLVLVSAMLVLGVGRSAQELPQRAERLIRISARSAQALTALMAHSTAYADLYGAAGAGPGHLPCPDTDVAPGASFLDRRLSRAGPNPPCAHTPQQSGALPAHITVPSLRQGIDPDAVMAPALTYTVSSALINNPTDRVVNPAYLQSEGVHTLATVGIDPRLGTTTPLALKAGVMMPVLDRRVAVWLADVLGNGEWSAADILMPTCQHVVGCELGDLPVFSAPQFEGVARREHWFWRNLWPENFRIQIQPVCLVDRAGCDWVIDNKDRDRARQHVVPQLPPVVLRLQAVHAG